MTEIEVRDPFGAADDPALPTVALAIDPREATRQVARRLPRLVGPDGEAKLRAIRVTRHKPGKRCLIEYDVDVQRPDNGVERITLIGKIRHGRFGNEGYRMLSAFWDAGFDSESADGVSVPPPVGTLAKFRMWLQRKIVGESATDLIAGPDGRALARRIAEGAHKIHRGDIPTPQRHTIGDEMRILRECLATARAARPALATRIDALLTSCERVADAIPITPPAGIHRDFYADQIIGAGDRIYIVDLDLYCRGDPALDIGNFVGHLIEQSLRSTGRPDALADREEALVDRFAQLSGRDARPRVAAYAALTLARHVYLSTRFPERAPFTERILAHCEELVGRPVDPRRSVRCA